jgi:hypothetical protein
MLNLSNSNFLSNEQVKGIAPSIFAEKGIETLSRHYTHIPTSQVMEDMAKLGWGVIDAKQIRSKKSDGFQKHLIVFRNDSVVITSEDGDIVYPQILLTNSHDGRSSFVFRAGLFRMICENGLVVATQEFENVNIRHSGYSFEDLRVRIKDMIMQLPLTVESIKRMKAVELTPDKAQEFVTEALKIRFNEEQFNTYIFNINEILEPTRKEDEGKDLWSVFNVVQEKLLSGDFHYDTNSKNRKARKVKNFHMDMDINQKLFALADTMAS